MGGETSEIGPSTTNVLLEAAYFAPMAIARTSKRLGLRTEASMRFERGVDPQGIDRAALRLCELLGQSGRGVLDIARGVLDVRGSVPTPRRVRVRTERVNEVLGTDLKDGAIARYLVPIGFGCEIERPGHLDVTVPTFRPDTAREIDVTEEVGRHYGYARIPRRRPFPPQVGRLSAYQRERRFVRDVLAGEGIDEAWTPSLLAPDDHERAGVDGGEGEELRLANPLTPDESVLRRSLLPGMLKALAFNVARRQGEIRLFEIGHVFPVPSAERAKKAMEHDNPDLTLVDEREMLGVLMAYEGDDARAAVATWLTLEDALGLVGVRLLARSSEHAAGGGGLHPTRSADLVVDDRAGGGPARDPAGEREHRGWRAIGVVGEVDPSVLEAFGIGAEERVGWIEVDLGVMLGEVARRPKVARVVSRFPSNDIDLAFYVGEAVPAAALRSTLEEAAGDLLESIRLLDVYRGSGVPAGSRSLTWRLRFCALDHTLTDAEVGVVRARCIEAVERAHGARLRGRDG